MKRLLSVLTLLILAAPLVGCGIKGGLKTPPPLWGADQSDLNDNETEAETAQADDTEDASADDDFGYGIDVAKTP